MSWNEEQLNFMSNYLDDFQFSIFLLEKENEIEDINYFFNKGELNFENFEDIKVKLNSTKNIVEDYISLKLPFQSLIDTIKKKEDKINLVLNNISNETIKKIEDTYEKTILNNEVYYLDFNNEILEKKTKEISLNIINNISQHYKIILINYFIILFIILLIFIS